MQLKNTETRYGAVTKTMHWTTALIVVGLLCAGFLMGGIEDIALKFRVYNLHKSFGATVLFLTFARIAWHVHTKRPPLLASLKKWEKGAAHGVHILLYAALVLMPLSGWMMSSAGGRAVSVFGLFTLPDLVRQDDALRGLFGGVHYYLAFIIIALVCGHAGAALKHHFVARDGTLRRMLPVLALFLFAAVPAGADALQWRLIPARSMMEFRQQGGASGPIASFGAAAAFDTADLPSSRISLRANVSAAMAGPEFLNDPATQRALAASGNAAAIQPGAPGLFTFDSSEITRQGGNAFTMTGTAAMNDVVREISIPFTAALEKDGAAPNLVLSGVFPLSFADFIPGAGDDTPPVDVRFRLVQSPVTE